MTNKKMTLEEIKALAKENGFEVEAVKPKLHDIARYYWAGGIYGGSDYIFVDHTLEIVVTGNTRGAKSDMYTRNNMECKRLKDLKAEQTKFEAWGYKVFHNGDFSCQALNLLQAGSVDRSENKEFTLDELLAMKD